MMNPDEESSDRLNPEDELSDRMSQITRKSVNRRSKKNLLKNKRIQPMTQIQQAQPPFPSSSTTPKKKLRLKHTGNENAKRTHNNSFLPLVGFCQLDPMASGAASVGVVCLFLASFEHLPGDAPRGHSTNQGHTCCEREQL